MPEAVEPGIRVWVVERCHTWVVESGRDKGMGGEWGSPLPSYPNSTQPMSFAEYPPSAGTIPFWINSR